MSVRGFYPQCRAILQVILDGFGDKASDSDPLVIPVMPKTATVHINSYKQADSYSVVIDAGDLPFDPRIIRAGSIELFMFQTQGVKPGNRVLDRRDPLADADPGGVRSRDTLDTALLEFGAPIARDKFTLGNKPRIAGLFDDTDLEMSESGRWVTITGQDYTAHLASIQYPPDANGVARKIPTGKRLDLLVEDLLRAADPTGNLVVNVRGIDAAELPIVGKNLSAEQRGIPVEQGTTYWDVIYKTVERHGFIAFVSGLEVVISTPKILTESNASSVRLMTWGKNLNHLSMKRHLGKEQAPTIIVKSYSKKTGAITVQYPNGQTIDRSVVIDAVGKGKQQRHKAHTRVKETTHVSKSGKVKTTLRERDEYQIVDASPVTDRAVLEQIAETRYHLLGKAERTVLAKTKDLEDMHETNILDIEAGDAFFIEWDEFNRQTLADPAMTEGAKVAYLVRRGFNADVAAQIAKHYSILDGLDRPLRFKEGTLEWDVDQGIEIEMELQDFIVIDGIRPGDGATRETRSDKMGAACVDRNGAQIGAAQRSKLR